MAEGNRVLGQSNRWARRVPVVGMVAAVALLMPYDRVSRVWHEYLGLMMAVFYRVSCVASAEVAPQLVCGAVYAVSIGADGAGGWRGGLHGGIFAQCGCHIGAGASEVAATGLA